MIRVRAGRARLFVMETSSPQIPSPKITATTTRPTHFPESAGASETFRTSFMALLPQAIVTHPGRAWEESCGGGCAAIGGHGGGLWQNKILTRRGRGEWP